MLRKLVWFVLLAACSSDTDVKNDISSSTTILEDTSNDPTYPVRVEPEDLASNIDQNEILVTIDTLEAPTMNLVDALNGHVTLRDASGVEISVTLASFSEWSIRVVPSRELAEGWYELSLNLDGTQFKAQPMLNNSQSETPSSRFRVGSGPVLQKIVFCAEGSVQVHFSEPVLLPGQDQPGNPLTVFADQEECQALPFEQGASRLTYYQFKCNTTSPSAARVVRTGAITTGYVQATLLRNDSAASEVTVDLDDSPDSAYHIGACAYWHMP